jgi:hypothetical protein
MGRETMGIECEKFSFQRIFSDEKLEKTSTKLGLHAGSGRLPNIRTESRNCQIIKINDFSLFHLRRNVGFGVLEFHVALVVVPCVRHVGSLTTIIDLNCILITQIPL